MKVPILAFFVSIIITHVSIVAPICGSQVTDQIVMKRCLQLPLQEWGHKLNHTPTEPTTGGP